MRVLTSHLASAALLVLIGVAMPASGQGQTGGSQSPGSAGAISVSFAEWCARFFESPPAIQLQDAADAMSYTEPTWGARTFNWLAYTNRAQVAHLIEDEAKAKAALCELPPSVADAARAVGAAEEACEDAAPEPELARLEATALDLYRHARGLYRIVDGWATRVRLDRPPAPPWQEIGIDRTTQTLWRLEVCRRK